MNKLNTIKGVVENFERSTHTSGSSNSVSTMHLSMFNLGSKRILLKTVIPSVISNGDQVILAGFELNGQFQALACNNWSANWISPLKQQGCAFVSLIIFSVISFLLFFLILPIIFGLVCLFLAYKLKNHDHLLKKAHSMVIHSKALSPMNR